MLRGRKGSTAIYSSTMQQYDTRHIQKSVTLIYNLQMNSLKKEVFGEKRLPNLNPEKQVGLGSNMVQIIVCTYMCIGE